MSIQESSQTIVHAFLTAGILATIGITILLALTLRRVHDVLVALIPLLLAALFTLATTVIIGMPLNFANIIALPLLLGIGVAFDIYFVMNWRAGRPNPLQSGHAPLELAENSAASTALALAKALRTWSRMPV